MNKLWLILLLIPIFSFGQRFENLSYPRSFNISKIHSSSDQSSNGTYYIRPTDELIVNMVESRYKEWLKSNTHASVEQKNQILKQFEQEACLEIANSELKRSRGFSYVNQQNLSLIICKPGFNKLELNIPVADMKFFIDHHEQIQFKISGVKYSSDQIFICQKVEIQIPGKSGSHICELNIEQFNQVVTFPFKFDHLVDSSDIN